MATKLANTKENNVKIQVLKTIKETKWAGTTTHTSIDACLTAINLDSLNSGFYSPTAVRIAGLKGIYMINQDGSLYFEARIIKEDNNQYKIEYLTTSAYNEFENKYCELI